MTKSKATIFAVALLVAGVCQADLAKAENKSDRNLRIMVEAARKLAFALPENRAYLLVKQETIVSPVAMIFGYVDNAAACEEIAAALSDALRAGTFKCSPIF